MNKVFIIAGRISNDVDILDQDEEHDEANHELLLSTSELSKMQFLKKIGEYYDEVASGECNVTISLHHDIDCEDDAEEELSELSKKGLAKLSIVRY